MAIFAGVAFVFLLVSTILLWILNSRIRRGLLTWFGIQWILMTLGAAVVAAIGFMTKKTILLENPENKFMTTIAYLISTLSAVFLITSVLVMLLFRWPRFNHLVRITGQQSNPKGNYPDNWTFKEAWDSDKAMIWWIAFFNLIAGLLMAISSFLMWSISKFMIELARAALAIAGGLSIMFLVLSLYRIY